jgi:hypothetical protein
MMLVNPDMDYDGPIGPATYKNKLTKAEQAEQQVKYTQMVEMYSELVEREFFEVLHDPDLTTAVRVRKLVAMEQQFKEDSNKLSMYKAYISIHQRLDRQQQRMEEALDNFLDALDFRPE